jgi:hypothetical protein
VPQEPPLQIVRRSLQVANVVAGSNQQQGVEALDDNEETYWSSDGRLDNAWIRFDLSEPQLICQVGLKVRSHRTTSYPIRVAVDGRARWSGSVGRTLGYDTIRFEPTQGRSVMIMLAGVTHVEDAFGQIVEITGQRDQSDQQGGRSRLELIEVDIYGPVQEQ